MEEESKAARETPAQIVYTNCTINAAVINNHCDKATTHVAASNMNIGGSHVTKHRADSPKARKRNNTSPPELETPLKMTAEQASSQRERLEDVFQDEIIKALADITSFKKFAQSKNGLCLDQTDIQTIVEDHGGNDKKQMLEMLFKWQKIHGEKATVPEIRDLLQKYSRIHNPSGYIDLGNGMFGLYKTCFLCKKSKVYLGVQISKVVDIQTCAIKLVPNNEKNLREAEILVKLGSHVNVVSIIHVGIHHGDPHDYIYIAMELSWTKTVRNMIEEFMNLEKTFNEFFAWRLVEQLMRAVEFLHSHNIIHRDLKPENVLASDDWRHFKLTDYGLSKVIQDGFATIQTNADTGTAGYRSPETYVPNAKITAMVDLFSAGVTIGEIMANGKHPFGENQYRWSHNVINNKNLDLSHLCVTYKVKVTYFIKRMLEMDPKKRPTAKKVLHDVSIYFQTFQLKNQQTTVDESLATTSNALKELYIIDTEKVNAIIMFDDSDEHLYSFNLQTKKLRRMQEFPECSHLFTTVVSGKHIYYIQNQKVHQLEYSDSAAEWKKMSSTIGEHGENPVAAVLNGLIYVCGSGDGRAASRSVERYDAALDRWDRMSDMNIARMLHAVVATEDHIYCIGGYGEQFVELQSVERFDEMLNKWEFVESAPRPTFWTDAAVVKNRIYVALEDYAGLLCYDIQNNSWSKTNLTIKWPFVKYCNVVKILAVDDELYIIGHILDDDNDDEDKEDGMKFAIYLLKPETKQMTLVEEFEDKLINTHSCLAVKLEINF